MTDINKTILEKAAGPTRFNPDEQRRFLETYEERVIASCTLEEARDKIYLEQYSTILTDISSILTNISERFHLYWSKSPQLWMKTASYNI